MPIKKRDDPPAGGREDDVKRKLRQFKRFEARLLGGETPVWADFFSRSGKFPPGAVASMAREEYKDAVAEYFAAVYYQYYKRNGLGNAYNPGALSRLGLPPDAGQEDVKRRFRELAKRYHPDVGGDALQFIEMMDIYKKLTDNV